MKHKRYWFTLFEVLFMVIIISVGILWILVALNNGFAFLQRSREKTIAINLAREWIEAVYQIRDSNRKRRGWKKENCRLKANPLLTSPDCELDPWMTAGYYTLIQATTGQQEYFFLSGSYATGVEFSGGADTWDFDFSLCENSDNTRSACPGSQAQSKEGLFFRQIHGIWLFQKDSPEIGGHEIVCTDWSSAALCGNASPKEFRFCSEVYYIGIGQWKVTLCGMLTNFPKK